MRTTRILMLSLAMGGAVLLGACGSDSKTSSGAATATTAATATSGAVTTAASGGDNGYGGGPATTAPTTSAASATTAAPAGGTALAVGQLNGKDVIVDGQGFALYLFTKDSNGTSACAGGCATAWPPAAAPSGTPTLGTGLDAEDVTVITRADGTKQLAFYGHPLYRFGGDTAAGDTNGQGSGGVWFLVDTEGNAVK